MLAAEEERFTRKKHDASFPRRAIEFCLEPGPVLDYVAFYENPKVKFNRVLTTAAAMGKPARDAFVRLDAGLADRAARDHRAARVAHRRPPRPGRLRRPPPLARGERVLPVRVRLRRRDHRRRRRRVGDGDDRAGGVRRRRPPARDRGAGRLPALARALLLGLHRLPRVRGQRGRVQGDGDGALRGAAVRRRARARPADLRGRQLLARSRLLLVPLLDAQGLDRQGDAAARDGAAEARRALPSPARSAAGGTPTSPPASRR